MLKHAKDNTLNFCLPGPEAPLVAGIVDYFNQHAPEIQCFGPSKAAARMEGSKTFSKDFMKRHSIPTARYENFDDYDSARRHLDQVDYRVVIKADGLAAGKGVILPENIEQAQAALKEIMLDKEFGAAGNEVVIEEFLEGEEISILSLSDGETILSLPPAQDHKRIGDGDTGPNTGEWEPMRLRRAHRGNASRRLDRTALRPTIKGMKDEGFQFNGCLFTGLIADQIRSKGAGSTMFDSVIQKRNPFSHSCNLT